MLLCRFLLNLRQLNRASNGSGAVVPSNYSSLQFQVETRIIANLGNPLQDENDENEDDLRDDNARESSEYHGTSVEEVSRESE